MTLWYALDQDGHVAAFNTWGGAAVPTAATPIERDEEAWESLQRHARLRTLGARTFDPDREFAMRAQAGELVAGADPQGLRHQALSDDRQT